jgi:hypothetical protein
VSSDRGRSADGCLGVVLGVGGESVGHLSDPSTTFSSALAQCHGSGFLTLRLHFAHKSAVSIFIADITEEASLARLDLSSRARYFSLFAFRRL